MKNKFIYLAILAAGFASCEPEFENPVAQDYSAGDADFSTYVAVGNSLTAGYMDGTVSRGSQVNSFPNLLAQQFALVGGGEFTQPSFAEDVDNVGGILGVSGFNKRLVIDALEGRPEIISTGNIGVTLTPQATAYNNMGVPGAKSFHLLIPGYGSLNPYYARHATSPTATVLGDAMSKNPTFFTNWIGANDVLSYATSGGIGVDRTGNPNIAAYGINDITDPQAFAFHYNLIINGGVHPNFGTVTGLAQNGAKGVVATVPSVTSIPYFTTVPYNALPAEATATNASALQLYGFLAQVTGGRISPLSTAPGTKNPVLILDETLSDLSGTISGAASTIPTLAPFATALGQLYGRARQATSNDLILLPASSKIGQPNPLGTAPFNVNGVTFPLQDGDVLIPSEKTAIANATAAYNASIISIANANDLAVADMNVILTQLVSGLRAENGTLYTANYFSGGTSEFKVLFSLDGVHPNARGYSVIANEVIKVINSHYNARLPFLNPSNFPGINIVPTN
ncbi:G-D-S-L family lipolytic protein [Flavobacterium sp. UBA7663]|uniref:G-D-S-L family lipolytic protein n=1 Tax=Flavobacterium sp. UBA7663 TaxID=1946557 RepID=UPI0025C07092|nr:G-D-S-L family lipolytic protein [Flavobacterium sp. UBA7663]